MTNSTDQRRAAIAIVALVLLGCAYRVGQSAAPSSPDSASKTRVVVSTTVIRADNGILLPTGTEFRLDEHGETGASLQLTLLASREAVARHFRETTEPRDFRVIGYTVLDTE